MTLIDKESLVAEINRLDALYHTSKSLGGELFIEGLFCFLDTSEVKEEIKIGETEIYLEDDGGEPPYDGKQWLDLSCTEYEIPEDKFKDGDIVEMIIRKTQKGK